MKLYQILTIIALIAITIGGIGVLIKTGKEIWQSYKRSVAEEEKRRPVVDSIDFYDSKGRKVHRRELYEDMKGKEGRR